MPLQVLIVDDSRATRRFVARVLALSGLDIAGELLQAADGEEALAILEQQSVDLVLTDINMPRLNGEQFLRAMQSRPEFQGIPVVIVSTDATDNRKARVFALGATGYVTKPVTPEALREQVEAALGTKRALYERALILVCPVRTGAGHVVPLLDHAIANAFETMCFTAVDEILRDKPAEPENALTVQVRFGGDAVGALALSLGAQSVKRMAADFFGEEADEINQEQVDSFAGELANVICGEILGWCNADGHFELATPEVAPDAFRQPDGYWQYQAVYRLEDGDVAAALHLGLVDVEAFAASRVSR